MTEHEDLRPRPSSLVEYLGIAYTLEVVMEKLKREGKLSPEDARPTAFFTPAEINEGPCVCCNTMHPICGPHTDWPWVYFMGAACLCVSCYWTLLDLGVKPMPWEAGVKDVQTVKDGVRIAPEPDRNESGSEEIERLIGTPVSSGEMCWANLGSLCIFDKPLGDLIEDFGEAGKALTTSLFHQLIERGRSELARK